MGSAKTTPSVIGRNIRRLRGKKSTYKLAEEAGVCRQTLSGLENGYVKQGNPEHRTLEAIAAALGVTVASLLREPRRKRA